jgi:Flp pilus assembly protein TadD
MISFSVRGAWRAALPVSALVWLAACTSTPQAGGYGASAPKFNEAEIQRQQVMNADPTPNARGMYLSMIRDLQAKGSYYASLAHIEAFEQQHGAAPDVELMRAQAQREIGQTGDAEAIYARLLDTEAGAGAAQGMGLLAGARGDYGTAVRYLRQAAKKDPTNAAIVSDLGFALLRQGQTREARMPILQAAELAPDNAKILANLALLMLVSGDEARAVVVMDKAGLSTEARAAVRSLAQEISAPAVAARAAKVETFPVQPVPATAAPVAQVVPAAPVALPTPAQPVQPSVQLPAPTAPQVVLGGPMRPLLERFQQ